MVSNVQALIVILFLNTVNTPMEAWAITAKIYNGIEYNQSVDHN